jgi:hypothetical protein
MKLTIDIDSGFPVGLIALLAHRLGAKFTMHTAPLHEPERLMMLQQRSADPLAIITIGAIPAPYHDQQRLIAEIAKGLRS